MDDIDLDLFCAHFLERVAQRLDRAVNVALDDEVQFLEFPDFDPATQFFERHGLLRPDALFTLQLLTLGRDGACVLLVFEDVELVPGIRGAIKAKH